MTSVKKNHPAVTASLVLAALVGLTGCGTGATEPEAAGVPRAADSIAINDAWTKSADGEMTATFGVLSNSGDRDVVVLSARSSASGKTELHETTQNSAGEMVMRPVEAGMVVPAGGELRFEPGEKHLMMMQLTDPLEAGDEVVVTLTFGDDSTLDFTAPVKDFGGGDESYDGSADHAGEQ